MSSNNDDEVGGNNHEVVNELQQQQSSYQQQQQQQLLISALKSENHSEVRRIIAYNKDLFEQKIEINVDSHDCRGWYVLHYCCCYRAPFDIIKYIIDKYPKMVQEKSENGLYPLHLACVKNLSTAIVELLIEKFEEAIKKMDDNCYYPLHFACMGMQSDSIIRSLIEKFPDALKAQINDGYYPLHVACAYNQSNTIVELLIKESPLAVGQKLSNGSYPLHLALRSKQSDSNIRFLISCYAAAAKEKDIIGYFPLHLACNYNYSQSIILLLIGHYPEALLLNNNRGEDPYTLAKHIDLKLIVQQQSTQEQPTQGPPAQPGNAPSTYPDSVDYSNASITSSSSFSADREALRESIEQHNCQSIVTEKYVKSINTEEKLGSGFFGTVYRGYDSVLCKTVAIKTLDIKKLAGDVDEETIKEMKKTFHIEQKVLTTFNHPNITKLLAYSFPTELHGNYYLLYEYAERGSLDHFLVHKCSREQLSYRRRIIIAYEVLKALRFLHAGNPQIKKCFHRDVKSANIVLKKNLTAQLTDCGIAKLVHDDDSNQGTSSTMGKGSMGYICPEYASGFVQYEEKCDIFSFGIVMAELVTGRKQNTDFNFAKEYVVSGRRHIIDDIDPVFDFSPTRLPASIQGFSNLTIKCINRDVEPRPSGKEVMDELIDILEGYNGNKSVKQPPETIPNDSLCERCSSYRKYSDYPLCLFCVDSDRETRLVDKIIAHFNTATNEVTSTIINKIESIYANILPVMRGLDKRFNNEIPRLFIMVPADQKLFTKHPKSWFGSGALLFFFFKICIFDILEENQYAIRYIIDIGHDVNKVFMNDELHVLPNMIYMQI